IKVNSGTGLYNDSALRIGDGSSVTAPRSLILGVNTAGNGSSYIQSVYQGAGFYSPLNLNPQGGLVQVNPTAATTGTSLLVGGDMVVWGVSGSNKQMGRLG